MSPRSFWSLSWVACFPRVSGDEPIGNAHEALDLTFSPRERG